MNTEELEEEASLASATLADDAVLLTSFEVSVVSMTASVLFLSGIDALDFWILRGIFAPFDTERSRLLAVSATEESAVSATEGSAVSATGGFEDMAQELNGSTCVGAKVLRRLTFMNVRTLTDVDERRVVIPTFGDSNSG